MGDWEGNNIYSHWFEGEFWCATCQQTGYDFHQCGSANPPLKIERPPQEKLRLKSYKPDLAVKWCKWTFGVWHDYDNHTFFGIDIGPLEIVWRYTGYRP